MLGNVRVLMGSGFSAGQVAAMKGTHAFGKTAEGTTQSTAYLIAHALTEFSTVPAGSGAVLPSVGSGLCQAGDWIFIINGGANALLIYPPVGGAIPPNSLNAPLSLAVGGTIIFVSRGNGQYFGFGIGSAPTTPAPPPADVSAPQFVSAAVANATPNRVVISFNETLAATVTGTVTLSPSRTVSSQTVVGSTLEVVTSASYAFGDVITVALPAGLVRDAANNVSVSYSAQAVTNNIAAPVDSTAPAYVSASVSTGEPNKIVVYFSEALSATLTGSATVGGPPRTVSSQTVVGQSVEVVVNAAYASGDTITISYPAGWVRDAANNTVSVGTNRAVTNNIVSEGAIATTFDSLYAGGWTPNSGSSAVSQPALTIPAKSTNIMTGGYREPVFDTEMRVITAASEVGTTGNDVAVHDYSSQQAFNADSTKFNIQSRNGFHYIYDAATNAKIDMGGVNAQGPGAIVGMAGNCEPNWHPTDPNILTYTANGGGLIRYQLNVQTKTSSTLFDLTTLVRAQAGMSTAGKAWSVGEGRPSDDWNRWAFLVTTAGDACLGMVVYERSTNSILRSWQFTSAPNWVSISPSGNYVVASWYGTSAGSTYPASMAAETARSLNSKGGANVFKVSDGTHQALSMIGEHSDMGWDYEGKEVYISVSFSPGDGFTADGCMYTRRLEDPTVQVEYPIRTSGGTTGVQMHFSGRAIRRKGWALANKSPGVGSGAWDGQVFAVELVPTSLSPKIYRLFHHRSAGGDQFASPCATVNADFTRVIAHTQDTAGNDVDLCCLLPSWALPVAGSRAPAALTAPSISGSATPGGSLSRTAGTYGGLPAATVTGVWQQSANGTTGWADISVQTGSSYTVGVSNGVYVRYFETANNGTAPNATQASNVLLIQALAAPVNTVAPSSPTTTDTATAITAVAGTWTGNPTPSISFVWQRDISSTWTDSSFTTRTATLTPAGSWRPKETATNSQGTVTAFGATVTVSVPASEPQPTTAVTFSGANGTTLETLNAAWDGSTKFQIQSNTLQNMDATGGGTNRAYYTLATGTNQAAQTTIVQPTDMTQPDRLIWLTLHSTATVIGYVCEVGETQMRLYRVPDNTNPSAGAATQVAGPVAHGVAVATTNITVKMTELNGRIRVYVNGSSTAAIDYTDTSKLTGGAAGFYVYSGADPTRIKLLDFRYGSS